MIDHFPDPHVDAALRTLRECMTTVETPHSVEDTLLAAFTRQHAPASQPGPQVRWPRWLALPKWGAGIRLAGLAGAVFAAMLVLSLPPPRPTPVERAASGDDNTGFIALDSAEHIAQALAPQLIETDIARTALAGLGVPLSPDNAGDMVRAQFLVSADGQPLAWRLMRDRPTRQPDRG